MIVIDGKEAGGQILRSSLGLSAITGKPIKVINIRGARAERGLKTQHLEGVLAVAQLCDAEVKGASLGSREIEFMPKKVEAKELNIVIKTAGSIGLLFQSLQIASAFASNIVKINIKGGSTASSWSPTIHYIQNVFLPIVRKMGYNAEIKIVQEAFYPKGGAIVNINVYPVKKLNPIQLVERGKVRAIRGVSVVGSLPKHVLERQTNAAIKTLKEYGFDDIRISSQLVNTYSPGTSITLWAECENSIFGADNIGKRGVRAEEVGRTASLELIEAINSGATVDKWMSDQCLPFLVLAEGKSVIKAPELTEHARTNLEVLKHFFNFEYRIFGEKPVTIEISGIGFER